MLILLGDVSVEDALEKLETTSSAPISSAVVNNTILAILTLPQSVTMSSSGSGSNASQFSKRGECMYYSIANYFA